jgi:hypothetical protein
MDIGYCTSARQPTQFSIATTTQYLNRCNHRAAYQQFGYCRCSRDRVGRLASDFRCNTMRVDEQLATILNSVFQMKEEKGISFNDDNQPINTRILPIPKNRAPYCSYTTFNSCSLIRSTLVFPRHEEFGTCSV